MNPSPRTGQLLLLAIFATSCGPPQHSTGTTLPVRELSGKVFVTGSEPRSSVTLVPAEGQSVTLVGDLREELARLSGAEVRVRGVNRGNPRASDFEVKSYDVTNVDGVVPKVGILTAAGGGFRLVGSDTVELSNVPDELRSQAGAKVWIVGQDQGGSLGVQSYGILRKGNE